MINALDAYRESLKATATNAKTENADENAHSESESPKTVNETADYVSGKSIKKPSVVGKATDMGTEVQELSFQKSY